MTALLEVDDLRVAYGKVQALHGVSLRVEAGQIVTVIGANGAGKTTLLNAVMGLLPAQGTVRFDGRHLARADTQDLVDLGLALVSEKRDLFGSMSVEDNLVLGAFRHRRQGPAARRRSLDDVFAMFPRLAERRAQQAQTLSGGERQMLALGRALMGSPRLLMLDEPSLGLAPRIVRDILHRIQSLRDRGVSILLIEQNARAALQVADHAYVLELGQMVLDGPAAQVLHAAIAQDAHVHGSVGQADGFGGVVDLGGHGFRPCRKPLVGGGKSG